MAPFRFGDFTDSSTILLPPQPIQPFNLMSYSSVNQQNPPRRPIMSQRSQRLSQWTLASSSQVKINPSRKRSRDECSDKHSESAFAEPSSNTTNKTDSAHGLGIYSSNLVNDDPTLAERLTRKWPEEKSDNALQVKDAATSQVETVPEDISVPKSKFPRRDTSSDSNGENITVPSDNLLRSSREDPVIDQFTHFLGIGWARVNDDVGIQAAARGWARYIENHYPVSAVKLVLKSKGLDAYLAETKEGYFLFSEDLDEGRLVGSCWETCMANLQQSPIVYEGTETLKASRIVTPPLISSTLTSQIPSLHSAQAEDIMILV